jgi:hypothetical protein
VTKNECLSWLKALGDCVPEAKAGPARAWVESAPPSRWEVGVSSAGPLPRVEVRAFAENGEGFPRESRVYDLTAGKAASAMTYARRGGRVTASGGGKTLEFSAQPFSSEWLKDEALSAVLADFAALHPLGEIVTEWSVSGGKRAPSARLWVRPQKPLEWRRFSRLTLSDPFKAHGALYAYLLLDMRVRELAFHGEELWAYLGA